MLNYYSQEQQQWQLQPIWRMLRYTGSCGSSIAERCRYSFPVLECVSMFFAVYKVSGTSINRVFSKEKKNLSRKQSTKTKGWANVQSKQKRAKNPIKAGSDLRTIMNQFFF